MFADDTKAYGRADRTNDHEQLQADRLWDVGQKYGSFLPIQTNVLLYISDQEIPGMTTASMDQSS